MDTHPALFRQFFSSKYHIDQGVAWHNVVAHHDGSPSSAISRDSLATMVAWLQRTALYYNLSGNVII